MSCLDNASTTPPPLLFQSQGFTIVASVYLDTICLLLSNIYRSPIMPRTQNVIDFESNHDFEKMEGAIETGAHPGLILPLSFS